MKAHYTDPATGLRYHDKNVYQLIKGLVCFQIVRATVTLTLPSEHGCSARLSDGTRCEPYREVTRNLGYSRNGRDQGRIPYSALYSNLNRKIHLGIILQELHIQLARYQLPFTMSSSYAKPH